MLAQAIAAILNHPPKAHLSQAVREALEKLRPQITEEPMKTYVRDIDRYEAEILVWMQHHESLYHQVQTTIAPTQITEGSPAGNVMPQDMEAVINFRLAPPDTPESLIQACREVVDDQVALDYVQCIGPSIPSDTGMWGYKALQSTLEHYFDQMIFIPAQNKGATDARQYERICRCVLRFGPFLEEEDVSNEGIHGTNERISVRAYLQGIRVLLRLMEETCLDGKELLA